MTTKKPSRNHRPERPVVVTAADRGYTLALAVMGRSLIDNLAPGRKLTLYVLDGGMAARDRRKVIASWDLSRVDLRWLKPSRRALSGVPMLKGYGPTIYFRLLAPGLLPDTVRKAIYLDADTLVLDDIAPLWRTSLGGKALAAAQDTGFLSLEHAWFPCEELGLSPAGKYLSSGVLLMDLGRWRQERLAEKVLAFLRSSKHKLSFPDQDALNVVFAGQWRELHPRWNLMLHSAYRHLTDLPRPEMLRLARAIARPGILHFAAGPKPWERNCRHMRLFLYYVYLDRTRWRGWRPD